MTDSGSGAGIVEVTGAVGARVASGAARGARRASEPSPVEPPLHAANTATARVAAAIRTCAKIPRVPAPDLSNERRGLRVSIWATGIIGVVGIVWGWLVGSQMILFDGVFAFIGVLVSMVLVGASAMAAAGPTRKYPYGREGATPLAIFIQGFVILAMLAYAAVEAVYTIRDGGSDFEPGWAIVYAVVTTAASVVVWLWLARIAGYSDLLVSEAAAWKVGAFRGVGMIVGFGVMAVLIDSAWDDAAPYVDPAMVLVTVVAFVGTPVRLIRGTVIEMLEGVPSDEVQAPVLGIVRDVRERFDLREPVVRMTKIGPKLYVEIDVQVDPTVTVVQEHEVRTELQRRLHVLPYDVWLNLEFAPVGVDPL